MDHLNPPHQTINDVIAHMDQVIARCIRERSKLGYFAVLYRDVTGRVRDAIAAGRFENGPRMERFDIIFAERYLEALESHWQNKTTRRCWEVAFTAAPAWSPIILQHLLFGMSAHINFDLAIAAAQTAPGAELPALKRDFEEITVVLNEMTEDIQTRVARVSPWFRLIDRVGGRTDEQILSFAMRASRDLAWKAAEALASAAPDEAARETEVYDAVVAALGKKIRAPGRLLNLALLLIRLRETRDVPTVIETLRM